MQTAALESPPLMPAFADFVHVLLEQGIARLREPPQMAASEREAVLAALRDAFHDHILDIAGPSLTFSPAVALRAMQWTAWACWFLVHRGEPGRAVEDALAVFAPGNDAAEHATADVVLRLLPQVHRRARAASPRDPLTVRLEELLRRWPLSGVLADIDEPPLTPVLLGGHPGLLLLYAERLAQRPRPAWRAPGPAAEYIDLVFSERGLP
jgi:hypothetical protein